ncbi:MAG: SatD family protein [Chitinophagales bacterium]
MARQYILMADVISSRTFAPKGLAAQFAEVVAHINKRFKKDLLSPLTITLGDEFQGVAAHLPAAVEVLIAMEEAIVTRGLPFQLRYVLYYGSIETPVNTMKAHGMLGAGLTAARQQLGALKKKKRLRFHIETGKALRDSLHNETFFIFQSLTDGWHPRDSALLEAFLHWGDYRKVAEALNKDVSLVWRREKTLRIREYIAARAVLRQLTQL